jgi:hypothetical protein
MTHRLPTYFLSHGGGPWPWLKDLRPGVYDRLEQSLHDVGRELGELPRAVLMISGHWEADRFLLSSAARPPMYYDYSGFPPHTYQIRYNAPGEPALAEMIRSMLEQGGLPTGLDTRRGYDHGTFSLMHVLYPEAELPLVQLAMKTDFAPVEHMPSGLYPSDSTTGLQSSIRGLYVTRTASLPIPSGVVVRSFVLEREQGTSSYITPREPPPRRVIQAMEQPDRLWSIIGDDLDVVPTPGHARGTTMFLWDNGEHRLPFSGHTIWGISHRADS